MSSSNPPPSPPTSGNGFADKLLAKLGQKQKYAKQRNEPSEWVDVGPDDVEAAVRETKRNTEPSEANLAGNLTTLGNSFIAFVGAGILDIPYAYSKVGLFMGTVVLFIVAGICLHCMYLLVDCKLLLEKSGRQIKGYGDVGQQAFGKMGRRLVDFSLVVTQFGFCTAYLILISHNLTDVIRSSPQAYWYVWLCVPGQLMLSTLRHLKYLGSFSLVADVTMAFALSSVFYYCNKEIEDLKAGHISLERMQSNMSMVPYFFGVSIYCYEGIGMVIPIQNAMRNKHQFKLIWGLNMMLVTALFWGVGYMGYSAYGVTVRESIGSNLPSFERMTALVQLSLCLGLYFTFPIMMFPVYQILEELISSRGYTGNSEMRNSILRFSIVLASAFLASAVPSFSSFVVLVGSSTCSLLAFIFPAVFSLKIQGLNPIAVAREGTIIVLGVVAAILGTQDALARLQGS